MHVTTSIEIWTRWIALFGAFISTKGENYCRGPCEETVTLNASLDSEVSLPCRFDVANWSVPVKGSEPMAVWSQHQNSSLVQITHSGHVTFLDHRRGRVKVFPNLSSRGDFSISIGQLEVSDLGSYCCELSSYCCKVEIIRETKFGSTPKAESENTVLGSMLDNWYFIAAGAAILIFLLISPFCIFKIRRTYFKRTDDSYYVNYSEDASQNVAGSNDTVQRNNKQERGINRNRPATVYENAEHDPDHNVGVVKRPHCHKAPQEIASCSRTPQSNFGHHFYANQTEINKPTSSDRKKQTKKFQYQNPIYNH